MIKRHRYFYEHGQLWAAPTIRAVPRTPALRPALLALDGNRGITVCLSNNWLRRVVRRLVKNRAMRNRMLEGC